MPIEPQTETILSTVGVIGSILAALHFAWRKLRRERVEGHKDNAEINLMGSLERRIKAAEDRADKSEDRADKAFAQLREAMKEIGSLQAQVFELQRQLEQRTGLAPT